MTGEKKNPEERYMKQTNLSYIWYFDKLIQDCQIIVILPTQKFKDKN